MQQPDTEHQVWRLIILSLSVAFLRCGLRNGFIVIKKQARLESRC